jgi:hypothetical protein
MDLIEHSRYMSDEKDGKCSTNTDSKVGWKQFSPPLMLAKDSRTSSGIVCGEALLRVLFSNSR